VAVNNDPYERNTKTGEFILDDGQPTPGPTVSLLFEPESPYIGKVQDIVLLHRIADRKDTSRETRAVTETSDALTRLDPRLRVHLEPWAGSIPPITAAFSSSCESG
jgi:hypothetical protein